MLPMVLKEEGSAHFKATMLQATAVGGSVASVGLGFGPLGVGIFRANLGHVPLERDGVLEIYCLCGLLHATGRVAL